MINGRPYDVPAGPLDVRASFGEGMVLYDSRGVQVLTDNLGVTFDALHNGESYYLHRSAAVRPSCSENSKQAWFSVRFQIRCQGVRRT